MEPIDDMIVDEHHARLRQLERFTGAVRAAGVHISIDISVMEHVAGLAEQGPEAANGLQRGLSVGPCRPPGHRPGSVASVSWCPKPLLPVTAPPWSQRWQRPSRNSQLFRHDFCQ